MTTDPATADDQTANRRTLLGALGAGAVALAGTATGTSGAKTLTLTHVCTGDASYSVRVTGKLTPTSNVERDEDESDQSDQSTVSGYMAAGDRDTYTYTGEITDVTVHGPVQVTADGQRLYTPDCAKGDKIQTKQPDHDHDTTTAQDECSDCGGGHCPLANTVTVTANVETKGVVRYDIRVTGELELPSGERVQRCKGELDPKQSFEIEFSYSGEATVDVRGPGKVCIDQDKPCREARK